MAGTVTQINYYAGQTIRDNTVVVELKPENEAYTLQFTVSQTQSRRIKPGDPAEILYNWYGDEITAKAKARDANTAVAKKLAITIGSIKRPVNTAKALFIALYFLNLKASFNKVVIFCKKSISKRFIVKSSLFFIFFFAKYKNVNKTLLFF